MTPDHVELNFRHDARPAAIGAARRDVESALTTTHVKGTTAGDLMLLLSELVTNAVRHAEGDAFEIRLDVRPERLRLEVRDDGAGFAPNVAPREDGSGGYGLFIVEQLADRWGVEHDERGFVWLELDRRD